MHAAIRLIANLGFRDPVSASMKVFHWLPIAYRIKYKLCLMMHATVNCRNSTYITETLVPTSSLLNRARLRSSTSGTFDVPRSHGKPLAWDVTVPDRFAQSHITSTASNAGAAADKAACNKIKQESPA